EIPRFEVRNVGLSGVPPPAGLRGPFNVELVNDGRTTAVITEEALCFQLAEQLDEEEARYPFYCVKNIDFGVRVQPGKAYTISAESKLDDDQIEQIISRNAFLWVYGYLEYRDFTDQRYRKGFVSMFEIGKQYIHPDINGYVYSYKFLQRGPDIYSF